MSLAPQAGVYDVINEFVAVSGTAPFTLFNNANVSSGMIADKINAANSYLQGWVGLGGQAGSVLQNTQQKWFEVNYAAATLAANLAGLTVTDGFNVTLGGLAVQRVTAQTQAYKQFIENHMLVAQEVIKMLHPWFWVYGPNFPQGYDERGNPVTYWNVSQARDYGG